VGNGLDGRPLGKELRAWCDFVAELPFEVLVRDLQERFLRTASLLSIERHVSASDVHVGEDAKQIRIAG
jgi:hypothetical protein